ncbi:uncharacterized protein LOC142334817 [Convolutriloba macropyga]|uniref:uncharacterized protein LOC142334817 n=1 Tax=Convolutriloba macropyga TaxID=536237 RepID=UPI003F528E55
MVQNGVNKDKLTVDVSRSKGVVCMTASNADTSQSVEIEFSIENSITVEGQNYTQVSPPLGAALFNFSDYSVLKDSSSTCDAVAGTCTVSVFVDISLQSLKDKTDVFIQYTSSDGDGTSSFSLQSNSKCLSDSIGFNCTVTITALSDVTSFSFHVEMFLFDEQIEFGQPCPGASTAPVPPAETIDSQGASTAPVPPIEATVSQGTTIIHAHPLQTTVFPGASSIPARQSPTTLIPGALTVPVPPLQTSIVPGASSIPSPPSLTTLFPGALTTPATPLQTIVLPGNVN